MKVKKKYVNKKKTVISKRKLNCFLSVQLKFFLKMFVFNKKNKHKHSEHGAENTKTNFKCSKERHTIKEQIENRIKQNRTDYENHKSNEISFHIRCVLYALLFNCVLFISIPITILSLYVPLLVVLVFSFFLFLLIRIRYFVPITDMLSLTLSVMLSLHISLPICVFFFFCSNKQ